MFSWTLAIITFLIYFLLDAVYVYYTIQIGKLNSFRAAVAAVFIYGLAASGVLIYTTNPLYVIFILFGAFFGTLAVVEFEKRKKK